MEKLGNFLKRFWNFLWNDDSFAGWIFSVVFLFVFIKFIFFPVLGFVSGSALPLAIVESCSMFHNEGVSLGMGSWWDLRGELYREFDIDKGDFSNFIFNDGFNKGDILFIVRANPEKLKIGDIIVFEAPTKYPVIHRIVNIREEGGKKIFSTLGDNNNEQLSFEKEISEDVVIGKALLKVASYVGWVKLVFFEGSKPENQRGFCKRYLLTK